MGRWDQPCDAAPAAPNARRTLPSQVHPELHSKCWDSGESHVQPHTARENTTELKAAGQGLSTLLKSLLGPWFCPESGFLLEQQGAAPAEIKRWVWHLLLVSAPQRDGLFSVQFPFRFPAVAHAASLFSKVNFLHKTLCFPTHSFSHKEPEGVGSSLCFSLSTNYYGWMMKVSGQRCRVLTWCCFWFCGHVSKTNKVCRLTVEKGVIVNCIHLCTSRLNVCSSWGQWAASSFFSDAASWMDTQFG